MSNWRGLATVTGVLSARATAHLTQAGLAFNVTASHPTLAAATGVFIHLYSVLPNAALRNETLPERSSGGTVRVPPRLALDLHYQVSFVGDPSSFDVERMAGAVLTGFHADPVLSPTEIAAFVATQPAGSVLAASDLADQPEHVRITMQSADVEELSRLWGMSQRGFHRLSVLYRVSVVLLEPDVPVVRPRPVTEPIVTVFQLRRPQITTVASSARPQAVVQFGEELVVTGAQLRGDVTTIVLADQRPAPDTATDTELRLGFDAASGLRAGVYPLQVRHQVTLADGSARDGAASNTVPVALVPMVGAVAFTPVIEGNPPAVAGHSVRVALSPVPDASQAIELSLTATTDGTQRRSREVTIAAGLATFEFRPPLATGDYLVQATVDGAESLLGPTVTFP